MGTRAGSISLRPSGQFAIPAIFTTLFNWTFVPWAWAAVQTLRQYLWKIGRFAFHHRQTLHHQFLDLNGQPAEVPIPVFSILLGLPSTSSSDFFNGLRELFYSLLALFEVFLCAFLKIFQRGPDERNEGLIIALQRF